MSPSVPSRKEREKVCTACPEKCSPYLAKKQPLYSPSGKINFQLKENIDMRYTVCSNRNSISERDEHRYSAKDLERFREMNEEQKAEREERAKKTGLKFLEAFNGNRNELANFLNSPLKLFKQLKGKDRKVMESLVSLLAATELTTLKVDEREEFLKKIHKSKNTAILEERLHEAYDYLNIPIAKEFVIVDRMVDHSTSLCQQYLDYMVSQFYVLANLSDNPAPMNETYDHSARGSLYSIKLSEFLGFNEKYKTKFFCAALLHDHGKFAALNHPEKQEKIPREHPTTGAMFTEHIDPEKEISGIIGLHHAHQKDSYRYHDAKETEETVYLSKLLAIIDCYDAMATRRNGRYFGVTDKLLMRKLLPINKVRKELLKIYGDLDLTYNGLLLPQSNKKGELFINTMYEKGIFGSKTPLNPFAEKESFKYKC